jgi:hypothetical protein
LLVSNRFEFTYWVIVFVVWVEVVILTWGLEKSVVEEFALVGVVLLGVCIVEGIFEGCYSRLDLV